MKTVISVCGKKLAIARKTDCRLTTLVPANELALTRLQTPVRRYVCQTIELCVYVSMQFGANLLILAALESKIMYRK